MRKKKTGMDAQRGSTSCWVHEKEGVTGNRKQSLLSGRENCAQENQPQDASMFI